MTFITSFFLSSPSADALLAGTISLISRSCHKRGLVTLQWAVIKAGSVVGFDLSFLFFHSGLCWLWTRKSCLPCPRGVCFFRQQDLVWCDLHKDTDSLPILKMFHSPLPRHSSPHVYSLVRLPSLDVQLKTKFRWWRCSLDWGKSHESLVVFDQSVWCLCQTTLYKNVVHL